MDKEILFGATAPVGHSHDPKHPANAKINTFAELWFAPLLMLPALLEVILWEKQPESLEARPEITVKLKFI